MVEWRSILHRAVIVGALGYFVDVYDLLLFSLVSGASVTALGVTGTANVQSTVLTLLNWQMGGMLIGGFLWGIIGDKKGRLTVLFGSITLYSLANIANAFVQDIPTYAAMRFLAGLGLAGELGAAVTLVSEQLPKHLRGYGTAIVSSVGIFGAVVGGLVAKLTDWRIAYIVGGCLGLVLLITRISMVESGMFNKTKADANVPRGSVTMLFGNPSRASRMIRTTLVGLPIWCLIALFITASPFVAGDLGIENVNVINAVMSFYAAASVGGLFWGVLSQRIGSRKKTVMAALVATAICMFVYFFSFGANTTWFYVVCASLGFCTGYWSVFVTIAAENFGTNLRATVATTVPNLIRGTTVPLTLLYQLFNPTFGFARTAMVLAALCCVVALFAIRSLDETIARDLNYLEHATPSGAAASARNTEASA